MKKKLLEKNAPTDFMCDFQCTAQYNLITFQYINRILSIEILWKYVMKYSIGMSHSPIAHCLRQSMFSVHGFESCTSRLMVDFHRQLYSQCNVYSIDLQFLLLYACHNNNNNIFLFFVFVLLFSNAKINSHQFDKYEISFLICKC